MRYFDHASVGAGRLFEPLLLLATAAGRGHDDAGGARPHPDQEIVQIGAGRQVAVEVIEQQDNAFAAQQVQCLR